MEPVDVEAVVRAVLGGLLDRPPGELRAEMRLESGMGIDSLTMIDLAVSLEERLDIAFAPGATPADLSIETLGDLIRCVEGLVADRAASR